jgi:hypothetical protein
MFRIMHLPQRLIVQCSIVLLLAACYAASALAADAGRVKVSKGTVEIERGGKRIPVVVGTTVKVGDTLITGSDGKVGITFQDDSLLSTGPNSVLTINRFVFDTTTHKGEFDSSLKRGTLTAVSGKLVKAQAESMRVRTPAAIMGVRGTEFAIQVAETTEH